ncbi:hypothetical protein BRARA_E01393 [Brassica rapa]|uniref:Uncharacterized protein n=1 Tax=Brassica campestris TaxID=3711 RepID=A0A397ZG02_BRACM|nr:hypothetical protein BRARA_E01393 [Brassica rapa]
MRIPSTIGTEDPTNHRAAMKPEMDPNPQRHRKTSLERRRRQRLRGRYAHYEAKKTFDLADRTSKRPTHRHRHSKDRKEEKISNLTSELLNADSSVLHKPSRLAVLTDIPIASDFQELPPTVMITGSRTFASRGEDECKRQ